MAIRETRTRLPFHIDAWVVLPEHLHWLWTLPEGDADFPTRWQAIKTAFSKSLPRAPSPTSASLRPRESGIWQRRYWEHTIRDERDYTAHMDYIHFNPVKHGLAHHPAAWPYSTFKTCVAKGQYPPDWNGSANAEIKTPGEPPKHP